MDETMTTIENTTQQQLAEFQAKVEGLRVDPVKEDVAPTATTPIDLEKTPEFEAWKAVKIQECLDYLRGNWQIEVTPEKLVLHDDYLGFPDPENRRAYAMVWSYKYTAETDSVAINPATGRQMIYRIWRKIDPPAPVPEPII